MRLQLALSSRQEHQRHGGFDKSVEVGKFHGKQRLILASAQTLKRVSLFSLCLGLAKLMSDWTKYSSCDYILFLYEKLTSGAVDCLRSEPKVS